MIGLISMLSKNFSFIKDVHYVLIETLSLYKVLPYFFKSDVDYRINPSVLLLNMEIW